MNQFQTQFKKILVMYQCLKLYNILFHRQKNMAFGTKTLIMRLDTTEVQIFRYMQNIIFELVASWSETL